MHNVVVVEEFFYLHVFDLVEMSNIFVNQIPKLLSLSLHLETGTACSDKQGRLHAFRKMTFDELPNTDCHAAQRSELVAMLEEEKKIDRAPLCISIAYDW